MRRAADPGRGARGERRIPPGGGRPAAERRESPEPRALLSLFPSRSERYEEGIPLDCASAGGIGDAGGGDDAGGSDVHWEDGAADAEPWREDDDAGDAEAARDGAEQPRAGRGATSDSLAATKNTTINLLGFCIGDAGGGDDAGGSDVHWEDGAADAEPWREDDDAGDAEAARDGAEEPRAGRGATSDSSAATKNTTIILLGFCKRKRNSLSFSLSLSLFLSIHLSFLRQIDNSSYFLFQCREQQGERMQGKGERGELGQPGVGKRGKDGPGTGSGKGEEREAAGIS